MLRFNGRHGRAFFLYALDILTMTGHRKYSGLNRPAYRVAQTDRQGYRYVQTVRGPIVAERVNAFGLMAKVFGR